MNAPTLKNEGFLSKWLGLSSAVTAERAPLQLVALEERVLYSAGPVPAEVVDVDLMSQGDTQGLEANEFGVSAFEVAATGTLEYLQQQVDAANSLDSIDDIQPLEIVPSDLDDEDAFGVDAAEALSDQLLEAAEETDVVGVASDLQGSERVTAAVSAGFDPGVSISGRVLHDVDGDGSVDENLILEGVEVRLYTDLGNGTLGDRDIDDNGFFTEITNERGEYEFTDLEVGNTYFIVVDSSTLGRHFELNQLLNDGYDAGDVWGVQTYAAEGALFDHGSGLEQHAGGAFYGGYSTDQSDASQNPLSADGVEHIIRSFETTEDQTDVDFGFSFNVVTNTFAGGIEDHDPSSDRTVQGSLKQFINNANAISGDNEMRFVPVVDATSLAATGDLWQINVEQALPTVTDVGTSINGLAYHTDGSLITTSAANVSPADSSVNGVGVDDSLLGPGFRPLLQLSGESSNGAAGLIGRADNFEVSNLAIVNFATGIVVLGEDTSNASIHDNFIGIYADGSNASDLQLNGIIVLDADNGNIQNNYIVDSFNTGILISGSVDLDQNTGDQAENWRVENNYIVNETITAELFSDGIGLTRGTDGAVIFNNRIENSVEFGIDLWNNRSDVTIEQNTITNSGAIRPSDGELIGAAIGLASAGNDVLNNEFVDNNAGILVRGTAEFGFTNIESATGNLISSNYYENNAGLDIDTTRPQDLPLDDSGSVEISAGDGLDDLDGVLDADTGSNGIDRPVLTGVSLRGGVLSVEGSYLNLIQDPQIELYLLGANDSRLHFATIGVANQTSYDSSTGEFTAELIEPTGGWPTELVGGTEVAAIIIDGVSSDTSEFGSPTVVVINEPADFDTLAASFAVAENILQVVDLESTDPEGGRVNYSIIGGDDAALFAITQNTGVLSFLTAPDFENATDSDLNNEYSLIINVQDDQGNGTDREMTITVTDENEVATLDRTEFSQLENRVDVFHLNANPGNDAEFAYDFAPGGDSALFHFETSIQGENTGGFSFINAPDFENPIDENGDGIYTFTVTATSDTGYEVTEQIDLVVNDVPETPEIPFTEFTTEENQPSTFTLFANIDDDTDITFAALDGLDQDAFTFSSDGNGFQFQFSDAPDFENPTDADNDNVYEFVLSAQSVHGFEVIETISVSVTDVVETATLTQTAFTQPENTTNSQFLDATAPDGSSYVYHLLSGDDNAAIAFNENGEFSLLTAPDFENPADSNGDGVYSFTVFAQSSTGVTVTEQIDLEITDLDEIAVISSTEFATEENLQTGFTLNATTLDNSEITYTIIGGPDQGEFTFMRSGNNFEFQFNVAPDFENPSDTNNNNAYEFVLRAESDTGYNSTELITVSVTDVIETATLTQTGFEQAENVINSHFLDATASDGSSYVYQLLSGDDSEAIAFHESGEFSLLTAPDFENPADSNGDGVYSFTVFAETNTGVTVTEQINLEVTNVGEVAVISSTEFFTDENFNPDFVLSTTAFDGSDITYTVIGGSDQGEFTFTPDGNEFKFQFNATPDFENSTDASNDNIYEFILKADSITGYEAIETIIVNVTDVVETATLTQTGFTQLENVNISHFLDATSPDGSAYVYQLLPGGDSGAVDLNENGEFSLLTPPDFENPADRNGDGVYSFTVFAETNTGITVTEQINLEVTDVGEVAVISSPVFATEENLQQNFMLNTTTQDGSDITYTVIGGPDQAEFTLMRSGNNLEFQFNVAPDFENPTDADGDNVYQFVLKAASNTGYEAVETISVSVLDVVEAITLTNSSFEQQENQIREFQLDASAADGSSLTYQILPGGDSDLIDFNNATGEFSLLTAPDFENFADANEDGEYSFFVNLSSAGVELTSEITINIIDVAETAIFATTDFLTQENSLELFAFDAIASNGSELNYSIVGGDDFSAIKLSSDMTQFSLLDLPNFEAPTDFNGNNVYEFTVRAQNDTGIDVTQEIRVVVGDVVETVVAIDDSAVVDEGETVQIDVIANDDIDPLDQLELIEVVSATNGTATVNSVGQIEFVHDGSDTTSAEVTYRIVNQELSESSATVSVEVFPVDDLAILKSDQIEVDLLRNTSFTIATVADLMLNDFDSDSNLSDFDIEIVQGSFSRSQGTIEVDNQGDVIFTPNDGFDGSDVVFQYQFVDIMPDGSRQIRSDVTSVSVEFSQLPNREVNEQVSDRQTIDVTTIIPEGTGLKLPMTNENEEAVALPQSIELTNDSIVSQSGYITPDDVGSGEDRASLTLDFEGNVYSYTGRTQFVDLVDLELSEFQLRDSIRSNTVQGNHLFLSQLIVGGSPVESSTGEEPSALSVGLQSAPLISGLAFTVAWGITGLTVGGSHVYRHYLDVGSLLDDDESIEDIVTS